MIFVCPPSSPNPPRQAAVPLSRPSCPIQRVALLLLTVLAAACGGDDENANPLAPSTPTSAAAGVATPASEYQPGAGGASTEEWPAAAPLGPDGMRASAPPSTCAPAPSIVAEAEGYRVMNNRPPGYGRSWRELLAFLGERDDVEPVTLAEMDARVGRWSGWKPFRDEVARLIDCGWSPGSTTIQANPQAPRPQQVVTPIENPGMRYVDHQVNKIIDEGESQRVRVFKTDSGNPGNRPVRVKYRMDTCTGTPGNSCSTGGTSFNHLTADVLSTYGLKLDGHGACPDGSGFCLSPPQGQWSNQGGYFFDFGVHTTDDDAVGLNQFWEICADPSSGLSSSDSGSKITRQCVALDILEDDMLRLSLRRGTYDGDYGVQLTVDRDYYRGVSVTMNATGAATLFASPDNGGEKERTLSLDAAESARSPVTIPIHCGDGVGHVEVSHPKGTSDREQVCPAPTPRAAPTPQRTVEFSVVGGVLKTQVTGGDAYTDTLRGYIITSGSAQLAGRTGALPMVVEGLTSQSAVKIGYPDDMSPPVAALACGAGAGYLDVIYLGRNTESATYAPYRRWKVCN